MAPASAYSQTVDWLGNYSSDWFDSRNWAGSAPENGLDSVSIQVKNTSGVYSPEITGGRQAVSGTVSIADDADTFGKLTVDGIGSALDIQGNAKVGVNGTGNLTITNGGFISAETASIGDKSGSTGSMTVDGRYSLMDINGSFWVGKGGAGDLMITHGGTLISENMSIAGNAGSTGSVTVDGFLSHLEVNQSLQVGESGAGTLTISNGGNVTSRNNVSIGDSAGSTGTVTVEGTGSSFNIDEKLRVGETGSGQLIISNGGTVHSMNTVSIGDNAGSTGSVAVTGSGSHLAANRSIQIGGAGFGELTVSNSGLVSATGASIGSKGTLNIGAASGQAAQAAGTLNTGIINISSGGKIVFNHSNTDYLFAPQLTGSAGVTHIAGNTTLTGVGSQVESVAVQGGVLQFTQAGAFSTSGDYRTQAQATTVVGAGDSTLNVGGVFTQEADSTLVVTLNDKNPVITADTAQLGGVLNIKGFAAINPTADSTLMSSSRLENAQFTVIHTTNGISGDFSNNMFGKTNGPDYLVGGGLISKNGLDYNVGLALAWTHGGQAEGTGTFTVADGTGFEVDTILSDQTGVFDSGWDGKSLTKSGEGVLLLSAANTYTGGTTLNAGTLGLSGSGTLGAATNTTTITGGTLALGNTTQTQAVVNQSGGTIQSGTMNVDTWQLSGGMLASDATMNAATSFDLQSGTINGVLGGTGNLQKTTSGTVTISGAGSQVADADVQAGTLQFTQPGAFTTSGDYNMRASATTDIGMGDSTLNIGGAYTQEANSTLLLTLNDKNPVITADTAQLDGDLKIKGFSINGDGTLVKTSELYGKQFTVIQTSKGVSGDFSNNMFGKIDGPDYLVGGGKVSDDKKNYNIGFAPAWTHGDQTQGTGSFTIADGTGFEVDNILVDQSGSFDSGWDGKSLIKAGNGLLVLSAVNTYTGSTTVNGGTLRTNVADTFASSSDVIVNGGVLDLNGNNQQANRLAGTGGQIVLNGAMLTASNATGSDSTTFAGDIVDGSATSSLTKTGEGTLTLSGTTGWTGDTRIEGGELVLDGSNGGAQLVSNIIGQDNTTLSLVNGATLTGSIDPTDVNIDTASSWNMTADSLVNNLTLAGTINFASPSTLPMSSGHTLTASNWTGQDGTVVLNTVLGNDASVTDKIVVNGDTSGNTFVQVNNAGGGGAQTVEGIRVVEVHGQSDGTFMKSGRIVAGAYDYNIVQKGTDWYLTSQYATPASGSPSSMIRPESGSYTANLAAANTMFITSLHDRLGETQYTDALTGEKKVTSMWLRQQGGHNHWTDASGQLDTQSNRYTVQLGGELAQWSTDGLQRWHLGMMAGYGTNSSNTDSDVTGYRSEGNVDGYSAGLYATWYQNDATKQGMYVDSWAQYSWFNNEVKGQDVQGEYYQSSGVTASVELGYTHKLGEFTGSQGSLQEWYIQPQAQAIWMGVKADNHRESNGTYVSGEGDGNLQTRLGARTYLKGHGKIDEGTGRTFQPFVEVNWIHNTQDFGTQMDGMNVYQTGARNIGEVKTGVEGQLSPRFTLWGNIGVQIGEKGYNDASAMLGGKYSF